MEHLQFAKVFQLNIVFVLSTLIEMLRVKFISNKYCHTNNENIFYVIEEAVNHNTVLVIGLIPSHCYYLYLND